ncbi:MAG: leucine-rich repeat domain-containing protein, partial [Oscillospiraceae bacterium]|nr:leucine-rich repeat domain-containing protein [Oscillospiraceae bacterium]
MQKLKTMLVLLLTLGLAVLLSTAALAATVSGTCGENVTWLLNMNTGVLTISGTGKMENTSWSSLPGSLPESITAVVIEDGVTSISDSAFDGCSSLTSITIPNSVTSIGSYAFRDCTSLTSITIPNSVTSIGQCAFEYCSSLTSIAIPDSVTSVDDYAFRGCTSLTSVTIGTSVTSIGVYAFNGCSSLTSITIPNSVTSIDYKAFVDTAYYNNDVNWENDVLYIDHWLVAAKQEISGNYAIKSGTIGIGSSAFYNCSSLSGVTIPNSVTSIGGSAFLGCSSLSSVTIPNSVTSIGSSAF